MGKPTGFLDYPREPLHDRPPLERIRDWEEMHLGYAEQTLREQGARCMDCGVPFCNTGKLFNGMASGCPVNNLIPEWNDLVWRGRWKEAWTRLVSTNNFPEFTGREVGKDRPATQLVREFEAVLLCGGATQARDLPVEGRSLAGIYAAMDFLQANTQSLLDSKLRDGKQISAKGQHVIVIGGGDTGTDCVGTSLRHGCRTLTQLEILPRPPDERAADNPWPQWPTPYKLDSGQEEAKALWGQDPRIYGVMTKRFLGDKDRHVRELLYVQVEWVKGPDGRFGPREIPGTEKVIPADLVLLAMGFVGPEKPMLAQLGVKIDERGNVWTDQTKMTSVPGVFAAGDMARGQSLE